MTTSRLNVSEKRQGGPLSFVVKFEAELASQPGNGQVDVQVASSIPEDADPKSVKLAVESIRRGAETVCSDRSLDMTMTLYNLVVHDVDLSPQKFESITTRELDRFLSVN